METSPAVKLGQPPVGYLVSEDRRPLGWLPRLLRWLVDWIVKKEL